MNRETLTDDSGRWSDADAVRRFEEAVILADDGTPVSLATGHSWEHETLYVTTKGTFIMHWRTERNRSVGKSRTSRAAVHTTRGAADCKPCFLLAGRRWGVP